MTFPDLIGLTGAAMILAAYAGVQLRRLDPHRITALLLNLLGSSLVMVSLAFRFNLGAFLLEAAWAVIALYSLVKLVANRKERP